MIIVGFIISAFPTFASRIPQVQYLIKEVEEARGRKVVTEKEASFVSSTTPNGRGGDATTAEAVVSGRLVLFRTIEEMQLRNRELLAVVRELSEQKELEEQVCMTVGRR